MSSPTAAVSMNHIVTSSVSSPNADVAVAAVAADANTSIAVGNGDWNVVEAMLHKKMGKNERRRAKLKEKKQLAKQTAAQAVVAVKSCPPSSDGSAKVRLTEQERQELQKQFKEKLNASRRARLPAASIKSMTKENDTVQDDSSRRNRNGREQRQMSLDDLFEQLKLGDDAQGKAHIKSLISSGKVKTLEDLQKAVFKLLQAKAASDPSFGGPDVSAGTHTNRAPLADAAASAASSARGAVGAGAAVAAGPGVSNEAAPDVELECP
jgi:hypothetical protein